MKVRQKNYQTNTVEQTTETSESIMNRLNEQIAVLTGQLITEGLVQNNDEARVLLTNALTTHSVGSAVVRITRNRIHEGHVVFDYPEENGHYANVNVETKPKKKPFYRMTARRDIYDQGFEVKQGDAIFTFRPESFPDADFECDRWSTKAKIGEEMPPGGWPEDML